MVIPSLVLGVCCVVILLGAVAELVEAARARVLTAGAGEVRGRLLAEVDPRPVVAWVALAAAAVLVPVILAGDERGAIGSATDTVLVVAVLGFAAERAGYLVRRASTVRVRAVGTGLVAVLTVAGGVSVALVS